MVQAHNDESWLEMEEAEARWAHVALERMRVHSKDGDEDFGFAEYQTGMLAR
jgi:hypothetical protein